MGNLPLRAPGSMQKREEKDCKNQRWWLLQENSVLHTQQDWCTYELRLWQHTLDLHRVTPDKIPERRKRSGQKVPSLTKNLFAIDTCWKRKESVFCNGVPLETLQAGLMLNTCKTESIFFCTLFASFWFFVCFFIWTFANFFGRGILLCIVCFYFCFWEKKNMK